MIQSDIIRTFCELVEDKKIVNDKEYKKQNEEVVKRFKLLETYLNEDKKLNEIFSHYDMEQGLLEGISQDIYFREGFLCGARLALEICGYENKNQSK